MLGRKEQAPSAAQRRIAKIPADIAKDAAPFADPMMLAEMDAPVRFGRWMEIVGLPKPAADRHFTCATALVAMNQVAAAERDQALYVTAAADDPENAMMAQSTRWRESRSGIVAPARLAASVAVSRVESDQAVRSARTSTP